jgi:hypothetical protein
VPTERQLTLDLDAGEREWERQAAMPDKQWERSQLILAARIEDGRDDRGQLVRGATLQLVLLSMNSFVKLRDGDCRASAETIGKRCGDASWDRLIPRPQTLSTRTVKSAIQALYNATPELLDRRNKGKRTERRLILWQYVRSRVMQIGATATRMGATGPQIGAMAPVMGATVAPQLSEVNPRRNVVKEPGFDDDADDVDVSFLRREIEEKALRFSAVVPCRSKRLRRLVWRTCALWQLGRLKKEVCEEVLEDLGEIERVRSPRNLILTLFTNRGVNLEALTQLVPDNLREPPLRKAPSDGHPHEA